MRTISLRVGFGLAPLLAASLVLCRLAHAQALDAGAAPPSSASPASSVSPASGSSAERADALFKQADALVAKGDYAGACPLLAESNKLDPALGTEFNLADCFEHIGKGARAHRIFTRVADAAHTAGKTNLEQRSRSRATALESKLAPASIDVTDPPPGLAVKLDGEDLPAENLGKPLFLDPTDHTIDATAPGKLPFNATVHLGGADGGPGRPIAHVAVGPFQAEGGAPVVAPPKSTEEPSGVKTWRTVGLVTAGVGVVGLAVGGVFGVIAIGKKNDANCTGQMCQPTPEVPAGRKCTDSPGPNSDLGKLCSAKSAANVSTVGFVAGGVLAAGGLALYFLAPKLGGGGDVQVTGAPTAGGVSFALQKRF